MKRIMVDPIINRGTSSPDVRQWVAKYIVERVKPKRVFDLGCGIGVYGATVRVLHREAAREITFIGLDGFLPYLMQETCREYYHSLIWGKVQDVISGLIAVRADLVICMDVIKHFDKFTAKAILRYGKRLIVSTPLFNLKQGAVGGNELEKHRCWFTEEEMNGLGFKTLCKFDYRQDDGQRGPIGAFERRE